MLVALGADSITGTPWCLLEEPRRRKTKVLDMVKTSCGAQQTAGSGFLGGQIAEYLNYFGRTVYHQSPRLSVLGAVKLSNFLLLLGRMGFGNIKGKLNRFLK